MSSDLLTYLMREKTAELERERAVEDLERAVEDAMIVRFPMAPFGLVHVGSNSLAVDGML